MNDAELELASPVPLVLDTHAGPALRIPRDRAAAMVDAALLGFDGAQPIAARPRAWGRMLALAATLLLAVVGGAAAARYYFEWVAPQSASDKAAHPPGPRVQSDRARSLAQPPSVEAATEAEPPTAASKPVRAGNGERSAPDDLLQRANRLRAAGQFRQAAEAYGQVYERFPRSTSAYVAHVAAAAIELEHLSNPTRARRLYEQALREQPQGALDLEARQGLSTAWRDLEDRTAETRVLQSLVNAHPDSPAARRAQVRLREIAGDAP